MGVEINSLPSSTVDPSTLKWFDWSGMPLFLSQALVCFEGNGTLLNLYAALNQPKHMYRVTLIAFSIISLLCLCLGLLSYRVYGDQVADTILFNMPKGNLSMAIQLMYTINILGSFMVNI